MKLTEYRTPLGTYLTPGENISPQEDGAVVLNGPVYLLQQMGGQVRPVPMNCERVIIPALLLSNTLVIEGLTVEMPEAQTACQAGCVKSEILSKVSADDKRTAA